ncbi:hypothetical protein D3C87_300080 [compost metagenome]
MITKVEFSKRALKDLKFVPAFILDKLETWVNCVEEQGLENVRKVPGYHDEPLHGDRQGQRSIRLNRSYRAIYIIIKAKIAFIRIEEVNKHDY